MKRLKQFITESNDTIRGVHFSHGKLTAVENAWSGTGIADERQKRLQYSPKHVKDKIGKTSFFYTGDNIKPEGGLGPNAHEAHFHKNSIYSLLWLKQPKICWFLFIWALSAMVTWVRP